MPDVQLYGTEQTPKTTGQYNGFFKEISEIYWYQLSGEIICSKKV